MGPDRATIITLGSALPPAIGIFGRLEALLRQPDTGLDEIVALVRVDPVLTFQVIRLGNSAFYGLKNHCDSLEEAVARIGFGDIHSLVGLVAARQACQQDLPAYQLSAGRFWENAVATSEIMAAVAARNGTDAHTAYSTGLLRNLGRIVLNNHVGAVRYPGAAATPDLTAWEKSTYGVTGAEVGATLLEHWRFSAATVAAVKFQAAPAAAELVVPAAMLHLSAAAAEAWGFGLPGETPLWREDSALHELAGITEADWRELLPAARVKFDRVTGIKWAAAA